MQNLDPSKELHGNGVFSFLYSRLNLRYNSMPDYLGQMRLLSIVSPSIAFGSMEGHVLQNTGEEYQSNTLKFMGILQNVIAI